jgi:predicted transcriptional regulator
MQTSVADSTAMCQSSVVITGRQVRAARAMLRLGTRQLADRAGVAPASIVRAEAAEDIPGMHTHTLQKIQAALEAAGIEFGADGVTVRLRRQR